MDKLNELKISDDMLDNVAGGKKSNVEPKKVFRCSYCNWAFQTEMECIAHEDICPDRPISMDM